MPARRTAILGNLLLAGFAVVFVALALEAAFRWVPALLPAGAYGAGRRDPELRMNVHGTRILYNKADYLVRTPNRDGFMDVDHARAKPPGVVRVGFFGDSYVESVQVPLEDVFFRRLAERGGPALETFGFGISGWGTLHAFEAWKVLAPRYDLDAAYYVFVENDLGDNALEIGGRRGPSDSKPFAELADAPPGYRVEWARPPGDAPWWRGIAKWLQHHSLLAHVVYERAAQLRAYGVSMRKSRANADMTSAAGAVPDANDLASTWPRPYAERAQQLGERMLADWKRAADARGTPLAVLYVPRAEDQLTGALPAGDTWLPWLRATCAKLGLPLVDPSGALLARVREGERVYLDHWTPSGHEAIAQALADHLATWRADVAALRAQDR
ncbi:MAG: hypothetical protein DCC71_14325 [Proteobacteria bacterium]|nr:MAG: hypothetical protein DCC71_14325 [Pseudomonadota bacterium]